MRQGKLTVRDVAREARVGVGTVSRVLSDAPHVGRQTRERVLAAVERLGFRPSRLAQGLAKGRTQTLGVLVPFFTKQYFLEILRGIEQAATANDYSLIIYNVERREQAITHMDFLVRTRRVDGLVVIALGGDAVTEAYGDMMPFPMVGVDTEILGGLSLLPDHERGMYLAIAHVASLGHQRIALIDRPQDPVSGALSQARQEGYRRACRESGLAWRDNYVLVVDYSEEGGHEAARKLLSLRQPPTALACASDLQAIGAMRAVAERGMRVGSDVAVTGYHDVDLAQYVGLTTVRLPAFEMGQTAARGLVDILAGRAQEPQTIMFSPELIMRNTCGAAGRAITA